MPDGDLVPGVARTTYQNRFRAAAKAPTRRPHIVAQVIPTAAGAHQGLNGGAFVVADFSNSPSVAYQDTALSGQILEDAPEVDALALAWDTLRLEALPRAASLELIEETAMEWK
jgi:hypothetical protein